MILPRLFLPEPVTQASPNTSEPPQCPSASPAVCCRGALGSGCSLEGRTLTVRSPCRPSPAFPRERTAPAAVRKRPQDANTKAVGALAVRPRGLYQGRPRSITSSGSRPSSPRALLRVQSITRQLPTLSRRDLRSGAGHRLCLRCSCSPLVLGSTLLFVHTVRQKSV